MSISGCENDSLPLVISLPSGSITKNGCVYCAYCSRTYFARSVCGSRSSTLARSSATVMPRRAGDWPGSERPLCDTAQTKRIACTSSIAARNPTTPRAMRQ